MTCCGLCSTGAPLRGHMGKDLEEGGLHLVIIMSMQQKIGFFLLCF